MSWFGVGFAYEPFVDRKQFLAWRTLYKYVRLSNEEHWQIISRVLERPKRLKTLVVKLPNANLRIDSMCALGQLEFLHLNCHELAHLDLKTANQLVVLHLNVAKRVNVSGLSALENLKEVSLAWGALEILDKLPHTVIALELITFRSTASFDFSSAPKLKGLSLVSRGSLDLAAFSNLQVLFLLELSGITDLKNIESLPAAFPKVKLIRISGGLGSYKVARELAGKTDPSVEVYFGNKVIARGTDVGNAPLEQND